MHAALVGLFLLRYIALSACEISIVRVHKNHIFFFFKEIMPSNFNNISVLVALSDRSITRMLVGSLKALNFGRADHADNGEAAFDRFCHHEHSIVVTDNLLGLGEIQPLIPQIRNKDGVSPNPLVPVLLNCSQDDSVNAQTFRTSGVTDLLLSPFSVDDIRTRISYILDNFPEHKDRDAPSQPIPKAKKAAGAETSEDEQELVKSLLTHYMQHHETVLQKLKFAQDATLQSINEVRDVGEELQNRDNTNLHEFSRFEKMWEEIIALFLEGGLAEDDIFAIEDMITNIPPDIKKHYNQLTQQDKSFLTLLEAMNHEAYRKARDVAIQVQDAPNPMTGMTKEEYEATGDNDNEGDDVSSIEALENLEDKVEKVGGATFIFRSPKS